MLNERLSQIIAESRPAFHGCDLLITDTRDRAALLSNTVGLDYRVSAERTDVLESFLEGLEFDSQRIRTFSVGIFDQSDPVGVVSLAIIPKRIFWNRRYFKRSEDGTIALTDFSHSIDADIPDFVVAPAWTRLKETHRQTIAFPWVRLIGRLLSEIENSCPGSLGIETVAQWPFRPKDPRAYDRMVDVLRVGDSVPSEMLGLDLCAFWTPQPESATTMKFARFLGLQTCLGIADAKTLWPVCYKRIRA